MSQYEVPARNKDQKIFVGWNSELETYFMRVIQTTPDGREGRVVDHVGTGCGSITDVEVLDSLVKRHNKAPDGLSPKVYKALFDDDVPPELQDFEE